ncbi:tetratricopeptide repeat protein [Candidatus Poribacteria bacterium]|nr:tetratricopeptide repeat protein [Candidatus Poribacteria bacterium]
MNLKVLGVIAGIVLAVVMLWPSGSSQKVKVLYEEAEQLLSEGKYEDAITKYNEALGESKKWGVNTEVIDKDFDSLAKYKIAFCYAKLGDTTGDLTYYDKALKYIKEVYAKAIVPKHKEAVTFLWGHVLFKMERYEEAEPKFRELIANFPSSTNVENAWYSVGVLNYQLERYEEARKAFRVIVDEFPNSKFRDDAQYRIAQSYMKEKNWEMAYQEFDKITPEMFPKQRQLIPEARYKAAYCLMMLNRDDEALSRYAQFVTDYPESRYITAAYFDMGTIYTRQKDYESALQNYQLALESTDDPRLKAEIQYNIGENYFDQEDYESALAAYQKVIQDYPNSSFVQPSKFKIGECYMKMKDWKNAVQAYQVVLKDYPGSEYEPYSTFQVGEAYYQLGDYEKALEWYKKAVDKFPKDPIMPYAMYGMLWSLSKLKRYEELEKLARQFIAERKNDEDFDLQAAEMQMKLGDIYFELAENDIKQGKVDSAINRYEQAIQEYAKTWTDYKELPKFNLIKCVSKFQEALSYYKIAEAQDFKDTQALRSCAKAYEQVLDKFYRNFDMSHDFPERSTVVENSLMNLGLTYEKLQDWDNARRIYSEIPASSPNYKKAQLLIAETYITEGKTDQGIEYYRKIIADPHFDKDTKTMAEIKLADLLRHSKRYLEAIQQYERIVKEYPDSEYADEAQYLVGLCYYSIEPRTKENLLKAIEAFQKLIDNYPNSNNVADAYFGIAQSRKELGEMGDETQWAKIIEICDYINSNFADKEDERTQKVVANANLLKVYAAEKAGSTEVGADALIASLRKVVQSRTADPETKARSQLKIGHMLFEAKKYQEAIPEYQKVADMFPQSSLAPLALYQVAVCYYKLGNYDTAAQTARAALSKYKLDPDMLVSVNYTLGLSLEKLNQNQDAIDAFKKVVSQEGKITKADRKNIIYAAHTELAKLYFATKQYPEAVVEYQYIVRNAKDDKIKAQALISMANVYETNLGDYQAAVDAYKQVAQMNIDPAFTASAYYRMGLIYANKLKDMQNASMMFDALIKGFSDSKDANIKAMVSDASVRLSDIYYKQGDLEKAITEAERIAKLVLSSPKSSMLQKVQAQYQVGYLYSQLARKYYEQEGGNTPGTEAYNSYTDAARKSAAAYAKVAELIQPVETAPKEAIKFLRFALFQAGQTYYALGYTKDHQAARPLLENYVKYADQGLFGDPKTDNELKKELQTAMSYLGTVYFQLARVNQLNMALFAKCAQVFSDMVRRWPNEPDAGRWQYQAGEAYFAMKDYQKALQEYRKVVDNYPNNPAAADALYAMAACYQILANQTDDPNKKKQYTDKVYALNEELVAKYPTSKYAGEAYINVGNKYYNDAIQPDVGVDKRIQLYEKAIEMYRKALQVPNVDPRVKAQAEGFLRDTEEAVAYDIYSKGLDMLDEAKRLKGEAQKKKALEVAKYFENLIQKYPNTTSADIAYIQVGTAYELMEDWEKALKAYEALRTKYVDKTTGKQIIPDSDSVIKALDYATQRYALVYQYYISTKGKK